MMKVEVGRSKFGFGARQAVKSYGWTLKICLKGMGMQLIARASAGSKKQWKIKTLLGVK
jgi:hypothetical protein